MGIDKINLIEMDFNLNHYTNLISSNSFIYPKNFLPFIDIDRGKYDTLKAEHEKNKFTVADTFKGLQIRVGDTHFRKVYQAQSSALNFSETSFPPYRFLMPEVLTDDWLAIVDIHKKHCRDHALHQPLTSYVVFCLLGGGNSKESFRIGDKYLLDICVDKVFDLFYNDDVDYLKEYIQNIKIDKVLLDRDNHLSRFIWKVLFYETAMNAAIFHDIGYPWQYINRLNKSLNHSDFNPDLQPTNTKNILDNFSHRLLMSAFNGYKKVKNDMPSDWNKNMSRLITKSLTSTHGFPGALGYLYLNDKIRKYPTTKSISPLHQLCVEWAALGIMMHDMGGIYWGNSNNIKPDNEQLQLSFEKDPLSCIIALADVIEDFERPLVHFQKCNSNICSSYTSPCIGAKLIHTTNKLEIKYLFISQNEVIKNKLIKEKGDQKTYFDSRYGYLDLSSIGINTVELKCMLI